MEDTGAGFTLFADDTTISTSGSSLRESRDKSVVAQERAEQWICSNRLLLNKAKTNKMVFTMRDMDECTECVSKTRFLGVTLDPKFQWDPHINEVAKKLARGCKKLISCVSEDVLRTAYFAFFYPHIAYAVLAGGPFIGSL